MDRICACACFQVDSQGCVKVLPCNILIGLNQALRMIFCATIILVCTTDTMSRQLSILIRSQRMVSVKVAGPGTLQGIRVEVNGQVLSQGGDVAAVQALKV